MIHNIPYAPDDAEPKKMKWCSSRITSRTHRDKLARTKSGLPAHTGQPNMLQAALLLPLPCEDRTTQFVDGVKNLEDHEPHPP